MLKKLTLEIKRILKDYKILFVQFFVLLFLFTFEFPYTISKTGGIIDLSTRINSLNDYKEVGSLNMAYVSEVPATIPNIIISYFNSNWDLSNREKTKEDLQEANFRGKMSLKESINSAFIVAYDNANIAYNESNKKITVTYIYEDAFTDLKVGDEIISINDKDIFSKEDISNQVSKLNVGDEIKIKVINNDKKYIRKATIKETNGKKIIGILSAETSDLALDPEITINFKESEYGASGGLMMSLAIYDHLTGEDITRGRKITGTGTIDRNGIVGEIDGIKYKLRGAVKKGSDIFLTPKGKNYEQAIDEKEKKHYDIIIVPIGTFEEALEYLKK